MHLQNSGAMLSALFTQIQTYLWQQRKTSSLKIEEIFCKIATGDWDAVIIGHSQFDMIHLSRERELETLYSEVDKLEAALDEISATSNKGSYSVKQVERAIKSYTDKIQKLLEKLLKKICFALSSLVSTNFVDESQAYKNLDTPTKCRMYQV